MNLNLNSVFFKLVNLNLKFEKKMSGSNPGNSWLKSLKKMSKNLYAFYKPVLTFGLFWVWFGVSIIFWV